MVQITFRLLFLAIVFAAKCLTNPIIADFDQQNKLNIDTTHDIRNIRLKRAWCCADFVEIDAAVAIPNELCLDPIEGRNLLVSNLEHSLCPVLSQFGRLILDQAIKQQTLSSSAKVCNLQSKTKLLSPLQPLLLSSGDNIPPISDANFITDSTKFEEKVLKLNPGNFYDKSQRDRLAFLMSGDYLKILHMAEVAYTAPDLLSPFSITDWYSFNKTTNRLLRHARRHVALSYNSHNNNLSQHDLLIASHHRHLPLGEVGDIDDGAACFRLTLQDVLISFTWLFVDG